MVLASGHIHARETEVDIEATTAGHCRVCETEVEVEVVTAYKTFVACPINKRFPHQVGVDVSIMARLQQPPYLCESSFSNRNGPILVVFKVPNAYNPKAIEIIHVSLAQLYVFDKLQSRSLILSTSRQ
jgi:hypothetical protein